MIKSNFHTHTNFCDGKNTAEEMILSAIEKGFSHIGFSGHIYTDFDESYCMSKEATKKYIAEIKSLKAKYKDKIKIYLGIEKDYYSKEPVNDFEYVIGSVHYVYKNGEYIPVDETSEIQKEAVNKHYNGDFLSFAKDYYEIVSEAAGDIVGHLDLISKFNEGNVLFDETSPEYIKLAEEAIQKLIKKGKIFEINTGAMSRGYRKTPYPSKELIKIINSLNGKIMINSDAHEKSGIDFGFEEALKLVKECGFKEIYIFDKTFKKIQI